MRVLPRAGPLIRRTVAAPLAGAVVATAASTASAVDGDAPDPLEQAHTHNDHERNRALFDTLDHGFGSVEADVWLVDGELLVAHDADELEPDRTLESLYLDPLHDIVRGNDGAVYPEWGGSLRLVIDIKSPAGATYAEVHRMLRRYRDMLTTYVGDQVAPGAVTVVISGERPLETMLAQPVRYAGYDGRFSDLDRRLPAGFMPMVSENWNKHFTWQGVGPMPEAERAKLSAMVEQAHAAGTRVRFYATPDLPAPARQVLWRELLAAGVDYLNTDDITGLQQFLTSGPTTSLAPDAGFH
ncbi:phosphatidylinositol-specific phospholipase C/glycerophosphodiester phosphodiesterase family protein [Haloactinopolyspora sp.]|uniref:phosphatidylinositol-specific phospholipase C/glycerophosphodiester phosphodiesterase family protein n=1 Tax=Haloactinopolyspora sp. TaxID=1966353 RepID=UPI00260E80B7|nr:phosphatidylinositol-specific phospholipase C/glycerophosphodiester phosphodiesterase family protein [Haloactinopolyspora sp.]